MNGGVEHRSLSDGCGVTCMGAVGVEIVRGMSIVGVSGEVGLGQEDDDRLTVLLVEWKSTLRFFYTA